MARESDIDFRQIALLVAVTAIGAILTWSATRETIRSAEEEARAKFESTAALYVNRIKSELDHGLDASEDLYRYYEPMKASMRPRSNAWSLPQAASTGTASSWVLSSRWGRATKTASCAMRAPNTVASLI
ncbi:hypothetical protein [Kordiimonas gwangyangensis]|uniref:hypothetical protein n=1 Tax=Kordiimonas gwangyangensis TaxID=288022 RepID=UPI00046EB791|nr:hypothetical protein [Kordiimonas gwangyangensis]